MKQVLKCQSLFIPETGTVEKDMSIVVDGNKIEKVVKTKDCHEEGAQVIDLRDRFVMPGMIDSHVHTVMNGGMHYEEIYGMTLGDLAFRSQTSAEADLMAGFTTLRDEGSIGFVDVALKRAINEGRVAGPRLFVSGIPVSATGGHFDTRFSPYVKSMWGLDSCTVDGAAECKKAVRYNFKYGADQIKVMATGGVMSSGDSPEGTEFTEEEMRAVIETVKTHKRISSAHAHGANGIKMAVRCGITTIEHGMLMDEECEDLMAEHGIYLNPTIIAGQSIIDIGTKGGLTEEMVEQSKQCLARYAGHLAACRKKGVKVVFGTDAGTPGNYHGKQAKEFQLMHDLGGFTPTELLLAATKVPAEMMGKTGEIGSMAKGAYADIIALKESPYDTLKAFQEVEFVMKDGKVYKK